MDAKIQELTEKIYNEGVERGQTEAQRLIAEAETKAKTIEADAQARAAALIADAERRAKELKENTQSELRLYSAQLVDSLRSSIADQIQGQVAELLRLQRQAAPRARGQHPLCRGQAHRLHDLP